MKITLHKFVKVIDVGQLLLYTTGLVSLMNLQRCDKVMKKATRQHTKQHNSHLILKTIYTEEKISRADIARATRLTKATVSSIVNDLMEEGYVVEAGFGPSIGGKRPRLLGFAEDARHLVALDLSSEAFEGALVNLRGVMVHHITLPVDGRTGESALNLVYHLLDQLLENATKPLFGIGIGTPGLVDANKGIVKSAVNLGWQDIPLKYLLKERYNLPVYIANDSHLASFASYSFGQHNTNNLVLINTGQGIGSGIVLNGQLYHGESFGAGEIGHVTVVPDGKRCSCGNQGCLETVASVRSLVAQSNLSWDAFVEANANQDAEIVALVEQAGRYMGTAVAFLIGILNVKHIIISGEMTRLGDNFLHAIQTAVQKQVLPSITVETTIKYVTISDNIILLGASAYVLDKQLGVI